MSNPFTAETGAQQPPKTYVVEEYAKRFNAEVLTPYAQSVGFKTYHFNSKIASVPIIVDEQYLKSFCQFWETAVKEIRQRFGITETEVVKSTSTASEGRQEVVSIPSFEALFSVLLNYLSSPLAVKELTERAKLRRSGAKTLTWSVSQMAARPTLQTSGLTSVPEDNSASSPARKSAKVDVLKRLRPPPLPAIWCWWVEKVKLNVKNEPESSTSVPGSAKAFVPILSHTLST